MIERLLITGGSSGIGRATVELAEREGVGRIVDLSRRSGHDVTDRKRLRHWLTLEAGRFDAMVLCAGAVDPPAEFIDAEWHEWDRAFAVNLDHQFQLLRWWARTQRPGPVVVIASTAGTRPEPTWVAYAAAKAALISLTRSVSVSLAPMGHRVFCVAPGRTATPLRARLAPHEDASSIMQPSEVAALVWDMLTDPSEFTEPGEVRVIR